MFVRPLTSPGNKIMMLVPSPDADTSGAGLGLFTPVLAMENRLSRRRGGGGGCKEGRVGVAAANQPCLHTKVPKTTPYCL